MIRSSLEEMTLHIHQFNKIIIQTNNYRSRNNLERGRTICTLVSKFNICRQTTRVFRIFSAQMFRPASRRTNCRFPRFPDTAETTWPLDRSKTAGKRGTPRQKEREKNEKRCSAFTFPRFYGRRTGRRISRRFVFSRDRGIKRGEISSRGESRAQQIYESLEVRTGKLCMTRQIIWCEFLKCPLLCIYFNWNCYYFLLIFSLSTVGGHLGINTY